MWGREPTRRAECANDEEDGRTDQTKAASVCGVDEERERGCVDGRRRHPFRGVRRTSGETHTPRGRHALDDAEKAEQGKTTLTSLPPPLPPTMAMASSQKANNNRKPYNGDRRALVLAFDVGTTFSGVSYAFLDKGEVPQIHGVTRYVPSSLLLAHLPTPFRYPGQEHVTGNTKIPSLLYYDRDGNLVAAGAEADNAQAVARAEDEGWVKCELFKLRLRPRRMQLDMNGMRLSPLPPGKSSEDVFGDFLAYLFACTRKFIEDTHANGQMLWDAVCHDIHFVLSHPNGWEGAQQSRMRRAAIKGGLIPNTDEGKARIRFVTEGEASMHACILSGLAHDVLASGNGFIVADAGGGTLDVSSYILRGTHPLQIEEVAPPDCKPLLVRTPLSSATLADSPLLLAGVFSGAVFVSRRCRVFLQGKHAHFLSQDEIFLMLMRFGFACILYRKAPKLEVWYGR